MFFADKGRFPEWTINPEQIPKSIRYYEVRTWQLFDLKKYIEDSKYKILFMAHYAISILLMV